MPLTEPYGEMRDGMVKTFLWAWIPERDYLRLKDALTKMRWHITDPAQLREVPCIVRKSTKRVGTKGESRVVEADSYDIPQFFLQYDMIRSKRTNALLQNDAKKVFQETVS